MSNFPDKTQFIEYAQRKSTVSLGDIINVSNNSDEFLLKIKRISLRDIYKIERNTVGQCKNKLWMKYRKHVISGSIAHRVNNAFKKGDVSFRVKALIAKETHVLKYIPALLYGQEMESVAIKAYVDKFQRVHVNLRCVQMGLKLYNKIPYIAGSVDGLLTCDCHGSMLIEVKCPYSLKDGSILRDGGKLAYLTNKLELKTTHAYYTQIQIYLGVFGLLNGKFVVWCRNDFISLNIEFDKTFFDTVVNNLDTYYRDCYLPYLFR